MVHDTVLIHVAGGRWSFVMSSRHLSCHMLGVVSLKGAGSSSTPKGTPLIVVCTLMSTVICGSRVRACYQCLLPWSTEWWYKWNDTMYASVCSPTEELWEVGSSPDVPRLHEQLVLWPDFENCKVRRRRSFCGMNKVSLPAIALTVSPQPWVASWLTTSWTEAPFEKLEGPPSPPPPFSLSVILQVHASNALHADREMLSWMVGLVAATRISEKDGRESGKGASHLRN